MPTRPSHSLEFRPDLPKELANAARRLFYVQACYPLLLTGFFMGSLSPAELAVFAQFQALRVFSLILGRPVVPVLAFVTGHGNAFTHGWSTSLWPWTG